MRCNQIGGSAFREDNKMIGDFTACALVQREPPEQAAASMKQYDLSCGP